MRLPKRYLRRVVKKRLIEFILMFSIISIVLFGVFMVGARSGTGILYQLGDDWYIDTNYRNNPDYFYMYLGIKNPDLFPHVLIPENNGMEVLYSHSTIYPITDIPIFVTVFTLDLVSVFILKQSILYICIMSIFSIALSYFYLNRKRFQFTNKLLG
ncbi:MAG: hypothetical protein KGD61_10845 [Candidatus Lokiarchaeota archaeon]|nr:hypothetical protein [Candidatus Lokiarchaeota archaeon]